MVDSTIRMEEDEVAFRGMIGMSLERTDFRWLATGSAVETRILWSIMHQI